jgi:1,4-alpha-glucan branching enzyme
MERRRASEGGQATPAPTGRELRERRQEVEAHREVAQETREKPAAYTVPTREAKRESDSQKFSWDKSDNAYDNTIQARLKRIEETKRKAEKLKKQAAERSETSKGRGKQRKQRSGGYFSGTVRESLQDPQAARVAFIYGEVLGRPISMRKEASSVPGLN